MKCPHPFIPLRAFVSSCETIVCLCLLAGTATADVAPADKYGEIARLEPFGPIPKGPTAEEAARLAALALAAQQADAPPLPPLAESVRVNAITKYGGVAAAGFTDLQTGRVYLLREGEAIQGFTMLKIEPAQNRVILRKDDREEAVPLSFAASQPTNIAQHVSADYLTALTVLQKKGDSVASTSEIPDEGLRVAEAAVPLWSADSATPPATTQIVALPESFQGLTSDIIAAATVPTEDGGERLSFRELHRLRVAESKRIADEERRARQEAEAKRREEELKAEQQKSEIDAMVAEAAKQSERRKLIQAIKLGETELGVDIELTADEAKELAEAGFEVPGYETVAPPVVFIDEDEEGNPVVVPIVQDEEDDE